MYNRFQEKNETPCSQPFWKTHTHRDKSKEGKILCGFLVGILWVSPNSRGFNMRDVGKIYRPPVKPMRTFYKLLLVLVGICSPKAISKQMGRNSLGLRGKTQKRPLLHSYVNCNCHPSPKTNLHPQLPRAQSRIGEASFSALAPRFLGGFI